MGNKKWCAWYTPLCGISTHRLWGMQIVCMKLTSLCGIPMHTAVPYGECNLSHAHKLVWNFKLPPVGNVTCCVWLTYPCMEFEITTDGECFESNHYTLNYTTCFVNKCSKLAWLIDMVGTPPILESMCTWPAYSSVEIRDKLATYISEPWRKCWISVEFENMYVLVV